MNPATGAAFNEWMEHQKQGKRKLWTCRCGPCNELRAAYLCWNRPLHVAKVDEYRKVNVAQRQRYIHGVVDAEREFEMSMAMIPYQGE